MMAYGVIPLVPKDKVWSQEFFKKEFPDYPFMFSNDVEAYAMVKLLMEDDSFYKKWARKLSKKVINEYEIVGLKRKMYDSLERAFLNKKASKIDSKDEKNWELKIKVSKGEING